MIRYRKQILIFMLIHSTTLLFAEIDIQTNIYDAAEEMIAFDEKMNKAIAKHNQMSEEEEDEALLNSMMINDFEESITGYKLEKEIANFDSNEISVNIQGNLLVISLKSTDKEIHKKKIHKEELNITEIETISSLESSLIIPDDADTSQMTQTFKNGILTITFPKQK